MRHAGACRAVLASVVGVLGVVLAAPAGATLLRNVRPGVMCRSEEALARLTLPDGSSRSMGPRATPADRAAAAAGGCVELSGGGMVVIATQRRRNTSVVMYRDELSGEAEPRPYVAPNVDFAPYPVPRSAFYDEIARNCPAKLEPVVVWDSSDELDLLDGFISTLPPATRRQVERRSAGKCEAGWRCQYDAESDAVSSLGLDARWADDVCEAKGVP